LAARFFAGRNPRTLAAYRRDLADFASFIGASSVEEASSRLIDAKHGAANALAHDYKANMIERGLQAATVNRRLAALRSLVKLANVLGLVPWRLSVESMKAAPYRDTRGPGTAALRDTLRAVAEPGDAKALRDVALLRLLHDVGLRRGEVVTLDLADVDMDRNCIWILGKGRTQREMITLPPPTLAALAKWISVRNPGPGALFHNFDRAGKGGGRLTGAGVYAIVRAAGEMAGAKVRPHGLRHLAITTALDGCNGDVRKVQRFSRHKNMQVLFAYDDNRRDMGSEVANLVAALV
jgi:integrase/recombinase XerC